MTESALLQKKRALFGASGSSPISQHRQRFGAALAATQINRVGLDQKQLNGGTKASHARTRTARD
jgi:hypothetical protein